MQAEENKDDDPCVIKNLDIEVEKGELIGVIGPVGSGKTAFFNTLLGEMRLDPNRRQCLEKYEKHQQIISYNANANDQSASEAQLDEELPHVYINGRIAYFAQACHIFSRTIRENIVFGFPFDKKKY